MDVAARVCPTAAKFSLTELLSNVGRVVSDLSQSSRGNMWRREPGRPIQAAPDRRALQPRAAQPAGRPFSGSLVSDRWNGYEHLRPTRRQVCWSHVQRDFCRHYEALLAEEETCGEQGNDHPGELAEPFAALRALHDAIRAPQPTLRKARWPPPLSRA
jgi:hypothetical protein